MTIKSVSAQSSEETNDSFSSTELNAMDNFVHVVQ